MKGHPSCPCCTRDCTFSAVTSQKNKNNSYKMSNYIFENGRFQAAMPPSSTCCHRPQRPGQRQGQQQQQRCLRRDRWPGCMQNKHSTVNEWVLRIFAKFPLENTVTLWLGKWSFISTESKWFCLVSSKYNAFDDQTNRTFCRHWTSWSTQHWLAINVKWSWYNLFWPPYWQIILKWILRPMRDDGVAPTMPLG